MNGTPKTSASNTKPPRRFCLTALIGLPWAAVLPAHAQAGRIELDALIKLALIPSQATHGVGHWRAGAQAGSPIDWLHSGLEETGDRGRQDYGVEFPFRRLVVARMQPSDLGITLNFEVH